RAVRPWTAPPSSPSPPAPRCVRRRCGGRAGHSGSRSASPSSRAAKDVRQPPASRHSLPATSAISSPKTCGTPSETAIPHLRGCRASARVRLVELGKTRRIPMAKAKTVSKADLVARVAESKGLRKKDVKDIMDAMLDQISGSLDTGAKVQLTGFGDRKSVVE